ncbi:hypothetical protein [Isoptericola sp. NPDC056605]|uniref:hypothetical protein n=1 Tax=Isoptericola sp. NPDC056605 TaxID=3345876 RepID=UPI0036A6AF3A
MSETSTIDAPTTALALEGRQAIANGQLTTVTRVDGDTLYVEHEPGRALAAGGVVVLPTTGEPVTVNGDPRVWVGTDTALTGAVALREGNLWTVWVSPSGDVYSGQHAITELDARKIVTGPPEPGMRAAMTAISNQRRAQQAAAADRAEWIERLTDEAHTYANDNALCERFDEFMEEHGMRRRTRDYDLRVEVTATLYITRNAESVDDAINDLERDDVWAHLNSSDLDWTSSER